MAEIKRTRANFRRARILEEEMLQYIDLFGGSERNKRIIAEYAHGKSFAELAREHGITCNRATQIVANFVVRVGSYQKYSKN